MKPTVRNPGHEGKRAAGETHLFNLFPQHVVQGLANPFGRPSTHFAMFEQNGAKVTLVQRLDQLQHVLGVNVGAEQAGAQGFARCGGGCQWVQGVRG